MNCALYREKKIALPVLRAGSFESLAEPLGYRADSPQGTFSHHRWFPFVSDAFDNPKKLDLCAEDVSFLPVLIGSSPMLVSL